MVFGLVGDQANSVSAEGSSVQSISVNASDSDPNVNADQDAEKAQARDRANKQLLSLGTLTAQLSGVKNDGARKELSDKIDHIRSALSSSETPSDQSGAIDAVGKAIGDQEIKEDFSEAMGASGGKALTGAMFMMAMAPFMKDLKAIKKVLDQYGVSGPEDPSHALAAGATGHGVSAPLPERQSEQGNQLNLQANA